jgi:hypothetical protein
MKDEEPQYMSYDDKVSVSIDADGQVLKCAKGLDASECGYIKGAAVCGKCGAKPMEVKMVPADIFTKVHEGDTEEGVVDMEETDDAEVMPKKKKKPAEVAAMDDEEDEDDEVDAEKADPASMGDEDEDMDAEEEDTDEDDEAVAVEEDEEDEEDEDEEEVPTEDEEDDEEEEEVPAEKGMHEFDEMAPFVKKKKKKGVPADMVDEDMVDEDEDMEMSPKMQENRKRRIASMGMDEKELGEDGYVCAIERKSLPGGSSVCADCPGGCIAEKGLPGLLHIEGLAEEMFDGKVIDSGYSPSSDLFVVDVQTKDGDSVEIFVDGTTSEVMGWHKLDGEKFEQKSVVDELVLIDFSEAADIAVKSIDGHVVAVEPDTFEGFDAYAVEIDGFDGKSYDVFVALDGEILGYDKYEPEEAEEIEAEAAEIALKRAFSDEKRMAMAEEGSALPDGSYPIASHGDLKNAIAAFGRAKDKDAAKRHIMKRARDLEMDEMIPASWVAGTSAPEKKTADEVDGEFMKSLVEFQLLESDIEL